MNLKYIIVAMLFIICIGHGLLHINEAMALNANDNIYVSPVGNDDYGDGSASNPFCTLSKAVSIANENCTIHVANGIYSGSLNRNITINKNLSIINDRTIQGNGIEARIDANQLGQIFIVENNVNFLLDSLVISNGALNEPRGYNGGAMSNDGGNVIIKNCTFENNQAIIKGGAIVSSGNLLINNSRFSNNQALGSGSVGGAIHNIGGKLTIISSDFTSNKAGDKNGGQGGAISNYGLLIVQKTTFELNEAGKGGENGEEVKGGGGTIANFDGFTDISECSFTSNFAAKGAGAIFNIANLNITDSNFTNNKAGMLGGAIVNSKNVNMNNVKAVGNVAQYGGFIDNGAYNSDPITCTVTDGEFSSNHADVNGGAFYSANMSTVKIDRSIFSGNRAEDCGGGIFNKGILDLHGGYIQDNMAIMQSGGGIENQGTITMNSSTIIKNKGCYGGGVNNYRTMNIQDSIIKGNTACIEGGGLSNNGNINITGSNITQNSVNTNSDSPGHGGGIGNNGNMTIQNSMITENTADIGGGIYNYKDDYSQGILRILDSMINNNIARGNGGGIENNAIAYANNTTIKDNIPNNVHGNPIQTIINKLSKDLVRK